jgi:hypothetical protein
LQLATISSIAVSFDLKLIEKSSGSNQYNPAGLSRIPEVARRDRRPTRA